MQKKLLLILLILYINTYAAPRPETLESEASITQDSIQSYAIIDHDLTVGEDALISGDTIIKKNLDVEGQADIEFLNVKNGAKICGDNVEICENLFVDGDLLLGGSLSSDNLNVTNTITTCQLNVSCNIDMNSSLNPFIGNINKGGNRFLHDFGNNTFVGSNTGNFTLNGLGLTAVGTNALQNISTGNYNSAVGDSSLIQLNTGSGNTATGYRSLLVNQSGNYNAAFGIDSLIFALGNNNTAMGAFSLNSLSTGDNNIAIGSFALNGLSGGNNNVAIGYFAGSNIGSGSDNIHISNVGQPSESNTIRIGTFGSQNRNFQAGISGITASGTDSQVVSINGSGQLGTGTIYQNINIASSTNALNGNIFQNGSKLLSTYGTSNIFLGINGNFTLTGFRNIGIGNSLLQSISSGSNNICIGDFAGQSITSATDNIIAGIQTGDAITTGSLNVILGNRALGNSNGSFNVAIGSDSLPSSTGSSNVAVGYQAGFQLTTGNNNIMITTNGLTNGLTTGSNNIIIGDSVANGNVSSQIWIGNNTQRLFIPGAAQANTVPTTALTINVTTGNIGITPSSIAYKENVRDITTDESERFMQLHPRAFTFKGDPIHTQQFGLIAEEAATICPELILHDGEGNIITVQYQLFYALLLKQIQANLAAIQSHTNTLNSISSDMQAAQQDINNLELAMSEYNTELIAVKSDIADLNQEMSNNNTAVGLINNRLNTLESNLQTLSTNTNNQLTSLTNTLNNAVTSINNLQTAINDLTTNTNTQINDITNALNSAVARITTLEALVNTLNNLLQA